MSEASESRSELDSLEAMLASLLPTPALDRDQILYESGRAAGLRERQNQNVARLRWLTWSTAALLMISLTTTAMWLQERGTARLVVENAPTEPVAPPVDEQHKPPIAPPAPGDARLVEVAVDSAKDKVTLVHFPARDYLLLRDKLLEQGVDALPASASMPASDQPLPTWRGGLRGI